MIPLEIPRRGQLCAVGNEILSPGSDYYSALIEDPEEQRFQRQDFCLSCWEGKKNHAFKSYWKAKVPFKQEPSEKEGSQDERVLAMLRESLSDTSTNGRANAFILALYLARKKLLILRQELQQGDQLISIYELVATEEMLSVPKVSVSFQEIQRIQTELTKKWKA